MLKTRVIPILLLKNRGLYKGVKFKNHKYVGDPINAVKIFNEKEVDELVLLDITASCENREPDFEFIADIASEAFMPFAYGGGIKTVETIKQLFSLGVEKVVLNTGALNNPGLIREASDIFGSQSIVVAIDVKKNLFGKYEVYSYSGKKNTKLSAFEWAKKAIEYGAGEILLNAIHKDGSLSGYDLALAEQMASLVFVPVILSGGAASVHDFKRAIDIGVSAVAAGTMFVCYGKNKAVLMQYPKRQEIRAILEK